MERKAELRRVLSRTPTTSRIRYADHIEGNGSSFFELICQPDLEGIVAKLKQGHRTSDLNESTWIKIKNRNYSQSEGRAEFFDRGRKPVQSIHAGWESCSLVCEEMEMAL
jgi:ATP-dependent DNA ligase